VPDEVDVNDVEAIEQRRAERARLPFRVEVPARARDHANAAAGGTSRSDLAEALLEEGMELGLGRLAQQRDVVDEERAAARELELAPQDDVFPVVDAPRPARLLDDCAWIADGKGDERPVVAAAVVNETGAHAALAPAARRDQHRDVDARGQPKIVVGPHLYWMDLLPT